MSFVLDNTLKDAVDRFRYLVPGKSGWQMVTGLPTELRVSVKDFLNLSTVFTKTC